jgi:Na+-transporting NADH:ubiquinone oxidoreductase subunit A
MIEISVDRGLTIDLGEVPPTEWTPVRAPRVALLGGDWPDVRPQVEVEVGSEVREGDTLVVDRARPEIRLVAPASGRVQAINRGARRRLESLVLEVDEHGPASAASPAAPTRGEGVREALQRAGLWPALRTRPFDLLPDPGAAVKEIYVTAMDTNPLAPDPAPYIAEHGEAFGRGVEALGELAEKVYVCMQAGAGLPCPDRSGIVPVEVSGPHPAGLVGTHIYEVARAERRRPAVTGVWYIGYQDVIAIGCLFLQGRPLTGRLVTVAGPGHPSPRTLVTQSGAELRSLTGDLDLDMTIVSGPLLAGRALTPTTGYLGRYHNQVGVLPPVKTLPPADERGPGMLALESFEQVWPFHVPILALLRALLTEDTETVSALGCTLLGEEDLALCSYMCPSRLDYGAALTRTLGEIRRGR